MEKDAPGLAIRELPEKEGLKTLPVGRLIFKDTPVPSKNLVGAEGMGLILTLDVIDRGRIHITGICCGLAYRIFCEIYWYARRRRQFDHPLTSSQDIAFHPQAISSRRVFLELEWTVEYALSCDDQRYAYSRYTLIQGSTYLT
jgi:hypothetical protein